MEQGLLFDDLEETTEDSECYVYHKTNNNMQMYGETVGKKAGRITICFDRMTEQEVRLTCNKIYNLINKD